MFSLLQPYIIGEKSACLNGQQHWQTCLTRILTERLIGQVLMSSPDMSVFIDNVLYVEGSPSNSVHLLTMREEYVMILDQGQLRSEGHNQEVLEIRPCIISSETNISSSKLTQPLNLTQKCVMTFIHSFVYRQSLIWSITLAFDEGSASNCILLTMT